MGSFLLGAEAAFVLAALVPFVFFGIGILYLLRLLVCAIPLRGHVQALSAPTGIPAADGRNDLDATSRKRFVLLVPAHNEELVLGAALDGLRMLDYPRSAYGIVVIADNCTDRTAEIARAHGAIAVERFDASLIGKGYALEWTLKALADAQSTSDSPLASASDFDALVILDADTLVAPNLLTAFESGLDRGLKAMQARYDVLNSRESWRTRLMTCALALAHVVKPLGRELLKLSDGLKGNGMCFARSVVAEVPWSGESIVEDIEYTLRLCRAGIRVAFLPETAVWAQMPTTGGQAVSQRKRWEGGRYKLLFSVAPRLLAEGFRDNNRLLRDRAMELIIPPFAEMFAGPIVLLVVCAAAGRAFGWSRAAGLAWAWLAILALQAVYLVGGLRLARVPLSVAMSLLYAPFYVVWKLGVYAVMLVAGSAGGWKRTERREL